MRCQTPLHSFRRVWWLWDSFFAFYSESVKPESYAIELGVPRRAAPFVPFATFATHCPTLVGTQRCEDQSFRTAIAAEQCLGQSLHCSGCRAALRDTHICALHASESRHHARTRALLRRRGLDDGDQRGADFGWTRDRESHKSRVGCRGRVNTKNARRHSWFRSVARRRPAGQPSSATAGTA